MCILCNDEWSHTYIMQIKKESGKPIKVKLEPSFEKESKNFFLQKVVFVPQLRKILNFFCSSE